MISTFHYVPRGKLESGLFVRTFMLGARVAFAQLCRRARRIIVFKANDKKLLVDRHGYPADRVVIMESEDMERIDWPKRSKQLLRLYGEVMNEKPGKLTPVAGKQRSGKKKTKGSDRARSRKK
jgi:hypothetical protein